MTEEPYRWLEAIGNRREYVEGQIRGGTPVMAASLSEGVLMLGVGTGHSKVFEIYDRHALGGLGHPADLERVRQGVIDAAHIEAFTRASADVSLRRLVSYGLGPQLKGAFEQIFSPPYLVRLLLAEVGAEPGNDTLARVDFDGTFRLQTGGVALVGDGAAPTEEAERWLVARVRVGGGIPAATALMLGAWRHLISGEALPEGMPDASALREAVSGRVVEAALLRRTSPPVARYQALDLAQLGLGDPTP